jgi:hypothetical protein
MYNQLGLGCWPSEYQRHAAVAKRAKIQRKIVDATSCPQSRNKLKLLSECKNVAVCLLFTYKL